MNPVWGSTLGVAIVAAGTWLLVWPLAGPGWAWAAATAVLAARVSYHARHLASFLAWLERPARDTLPVGSGIWEEAFARLHQHLKKRDDEQQGLLRALGRFRAAGRALPDGVVILDAEDHIEWSNPTAERHFGIDARRDFGQTITNLVRQPDFVAYLERHEYLVPLALHSARSDAALSVRVIEFGAEQKLLMSRDVTIEQRLEIMRRDFVANVSHELKTPVTVLSGFVDTLADESMELSGAQRKRFLSLMDEQARRMRRLIEDLLTLSALESGAMPEEEQTIEMRPFVEKLGEEARALSGGRHRIGVVARARLSPDRKRGRAQERVFQSGLECGALHAGRRDGAAYLARRGWARRSSASRTTASGSRRAMSRASPNVSTASTAVARARRAGPGSASRSSSMRSRGTKRRSTCTASRATARRSARCFRHSGSGFRPGTRGRVAHASGKIS